jgi:prevent-host-death family protein
MKRISIQDLKARLSAAIAEAEAGDTLLVTRHSEPVAQLSPVRDPSVHRGRHVGAGRLEPLLKRGTGGRYLAVLLEDRGTR